MANFRAERLFIRVSGMVKDFDPNEGIDHEQFATPMCMDNGTYERRPLSEFTFAPFDTVRWFRASEGLKVVREFIEELERTPGADDETLTTLRAVEDRLDWIDVKGHKFHFLARDLD